MRVQTVERTELAHLRHADAKQAIRAPDHPKPKERD